MWIAADNGAVGGAADQAVQHVAERLWVVPPAHGAQQLVAYPDPGQVPQPDGETDVSATVPARYTAAQVTTVTLLCGQTLYPYVSKHVQEVKGVIIKSHSYQ